MSSKAHSIHNEEVCDLLMSSGKYNDWVVTAEFYSALHLVLHQIFPLTYKTTVYQNFNRYFANEFKSKSKQKSKHAVIKQLVVDNLNQCSSSYKWLFDSCMSARYNNYVVKKAMAKKAKTELDNIKKYCPKS